MARLVLFTFGMIFLLFGILFTLLPMIPLGVPFIALALICFIPISQRITKIIQIARMRSKFANHMVETAIRFLPQVYARVLRRTDP